MAIMHSDLFAFFSRKLPDEQLLYHSPLPPYRHYEPPTSQFVAQKLILSLTPTEGVYEALTAAESKRIRTVVFLHRPFSLDRKRVPHGTLVLFSHVRYDELYTTGYNVAFAKLHNVSSVPQDRICLKGYKNDPERKFGLIGRLEAPVDARKYCDRLSRAFRGHDMIVLASEVPGELAQTKALGATQNVIPADSHSTSKSESPIQALCSLNAFNPDVLVKVAEASRQLGVKNEEVVCLTGAVRDLGVQEAQRRGFNMVAVGHKRCEDWGMMYLLEEVQKAFPALDVVWIDEEEEKVEKPPRVNKDVVHRKDGQKSVKA